MDQSTNSNGQNFDVITPTSGPKGQDSPSKTSPLSINVQDDDSNETTVQEVKTAPPLSAPVSDSTPITETNATTTPTASEPTNTQSATPAEPLPTLPAAAEQEFPRPEEKLPPVTPTPKKHHVSVLPIIISLIVAAGLAVLTVVVYQKTKSSDAAKTATPAPAAVARPQAEDIDAATEAADTALKNDDTADAAQNELTDATLGL